MRRSWVRTPKLGAHSAPEYVVGTETSGSPVAAEAAFAVSIAEPPPTASEPVGAGRAPRSGRDGTSAHRADGAAARRRESQRRLATRNGRAIPSSASTSGSSASDQRTITAPASRAKSTNALRRAALDPAARADEIDLALQLEPLDPRLGDRPRGQVGLDRRARDERHAVARRGRRSTPTPASRARASRRGRAAASRRGAARPRSAAARPRPPASRSGPRRAARRAPRSCPANRWLGGHARITSSRKNGSKTTPRCRRAAPTTPSSSSRAATRSTIVRVS